MDLKSLLLATDGNGVLNLTLYLRTLVQNAPNAQHKYPTTKFLLSNSSRVLILMAIGILRYLLTYNLVVANNGKALEQVDSNPIRTSSKGYIELSANKSPECYFPFQFLSILNYS